MDTVGCISNPAYESNNQQKIYISDSYCRSAHSVKYDESDFIETKNSTPRSIWMKQDNDKQCSGCGSVDYTPFVKLRGKRKSLSDSLNRRGKNETACSISQNDTHSFQEGNSFISRNYCCSDSNIDGYVEAVRERENIGFQDEEIPPLDDLLREKELSSFEKTQTVVTSTVISNENGDDLNVVHPSSYISLEKFTDNTKAIQDSAIHPVSWRDLNKNDEDLNVAHLLTSSSPEKNCSEKQIVPCYKENIVQINELNSDTDKHYADKHVISPISQHAVTRRMLKNIDNAVGEKHNGFGSAYTIITASGIDENTNISPASLIHPIEKYISVNDDGMEAKSHSEIEMNHAAVPTKDVALSPITWPVLLPAVRVDVASQTDIPSLQIKDSDVRILNSNEAKSNSSSGNCSNALCGQFSSKSQTSETKVSDKVSNDESNGRRRSLRKKSKRF